MQKEFEAIFAVIGDATRKLRKLNDAHEQTRQRRVAACVRKALGLMTLEEFRQRLH